MNRILKVIVVGLILLSTVLPVAAQDDSQLLQDAAELCTLGKHEASDIALLRQCAKRFAISQVDTMATMLENRLLDISHRQGIAATSALLRYAEQHYGEASREAVVCRRQVMSLYSDFDWSKADSLCKANRRCAERLCRQRPKDKDCRLLSLVVRLEDIIVQKQRVRWTGLDPEIFGTLFRKDDDLFVRLGVCLLLSGIFQDLRDILSGLCQRPHPENVS